MANHSVLKCVPEGYAAPERRAPLWLRVSAWIAVGACLWLWTSAQPVQASAMRQATPLPGAPGAPLQGDLPAQYDRHYLALTPSERDGTMVLTMAVDPQDNKELLGRVNFLVLTEDGLRRFLAGADPRTVEIASGNPVPFDPVGNRVRAIFRASGVGSYTVIVYNDSEFPASYSLSVQGGTLADESGQTKPAAAPSTGASSTGVVSPTIVASTPAPTATVATAQAAQAAQAEQAQTTVAGLPGLVTARRVSGALNTQFARHYLMLEPGARDAQVTLDLAYDPLDRKELIGNLNFWVLTEDGVRRMIRGDNPADLNLATGFQAPFSPFPNELQAQFRATGLGPYTTVVFNNSTVSATYSLEIQGGLLADQYGQTNESKAAAAETAAEQQALSAAAPVAAPAVTVAASESPALAPSESVTGSLVLASTERKPVRGALELTGDLAKAYEHDYVGLVPDRVDGRVILTLDFDPLDSQALRENINFWVLTEEALRQVTSGARPVDVNTAVGAPIQYGPEQGKLRAVFTASGQGDYTVIVYNNSDVPAIYKLAVEGGLLSDNSGNTLALTLP